MAPTEFSLRLQKGIAGGFLPAKPTAIYTLTRAGASSALQVLSALPSEQFGAFFADDMRDATPKTLSVNEEDHQKLIDELYGILKTIPMEYPRGSADIYGMNTSIAWGSEDLQWQNSAPDGCIHMQSETQATEQDKAKFKRTVEIVNYLVSKAS